MATNIAFDVEVQDLEYGLGLLARVYQPKGTGPFLAMVDVHGGAWVNGDRTNNATVCQALAERGVLVAALDFRQPPEAGYPASIADVNLGIRWLKANAAKFHGSSAVGAWGNSSGGHIVVLAGLRPQDPRYSERPLNDYPEVDARLSYVISGWPVIDPLYRYQNVALATNNQGQISAHQRYWGTEEAMAEGNPCNIVDSDEPIDLPPILYILKEGDKNHPLAMQERFISGYRKRGGSIRVETFSGLPEHGMEVSADVPDSLRVIDLMVEFASNNDRS